jgi:methionyl aminopeptidase
MFIKTSAEIEVMAEGGRRLASVLRKLGVSVRVGMTTRELDALAYRLITDFGCKPSFLNYRPAGAAKAYPATLCTSINDVVVHGLPSDYVVKDGELVKLDLGLIYRGFHVDAARTVPVGNISPEAKRLMIVTRKALDAGIKEAKLGHTLGDIGFAIQDVVRKAGYSVARGLTGHGIGRSLHEDPTVYNFGRRGQGEELEEGTVIAIEPMVNIGGGDIKQLKDDSYATRDGSLSAHFENTVAITKKGPRVLTE